MLDAKLYSVWGPYPVLPFGRQPTALVSIIRRSHHGGISNNQELLSRIEIVKFKRCCTPNIMG